MIKRKFNTCPRIPAAANTSTFLFGVKASINAVFSKDLVNCNHARFKSTESLKILFLFFGYREVIFHVISN